jgi:hypothetical protein
MTTEKNLATNVNLEFINQNLVGSGRLLHYALLESPWILDESLTAKLPI